MVFISETRERVVFMSETRGRVVFMSETLDRVVFNIRNSRSCDMAFVTETESRIKILTFIGQM